MTIGLRENYDFSPAGLADAEADLQRLQTQHAAVRAAQPATAICRAFENAVVAQGAKVNALKVALRQAGIAF